MKCSIEGCEKDAAKSKMCWSHWNRKQRYGDATVPKQRARGECVPWLQQAFETETDDCLIWPFSKQGQERNRGWIAHPNYSSHDPSKIICEMVNGPCPEGMENRHLCNNSLCCNKRHVIWSTHIDNIHDKYAFGTIWRNK